MHYSDSINQNAEFLRLVVPFLAKHRLAANPIAYTVCYEYFTCENQALRTEIDSMLEQGKLLTNQFIQSAFDRYIAGDSQVNLHYLHDKVWRVISNLSKSTVSVDQKASQFSESLVQYVDRLAGNSDEYPIEQVVKNLMADTLSMQNTTLRLQVQLDESQREISLLRNQLNEIREEILIDALTGLTNRKGFKQKIDLATSESRRSAQNYCVLMIDIDHFKTINDSYGHLVGDKVIQFVAATMQKQVKGKDTVGRFGGDEFVILLLDTELCGALSVAGSIRSIIEKTRIKRMDTGEPIGQVTISIGIAKHLEGESVGELLERADSALYQSKTKGRNRVTVDDCDVIPLKTNRA